MQLPVGLSILLQTANFDELAKTCPEIANEVGWMPQSRKQNLSWKNYNLL
jgi:hypothetical protein